MKEAIEYLRPVDFNQLTTGGEKVTDMHYTVGTIKTIVTLLEDLGSGVITQDELVYYYKEGFWQKLDDSYVIDVLSQAALKIGVPETKAVYSRFCIMPQH